MDVRGLFAGMGLSTDTVLKLVDDGMALLPPDAQKQANDAVAPVAAQVKADARWVLLGAASAAVVLVLVVLHVLGLLKPLTVTMGILYYAWVTVTAIEADDQVTKTTMLVYWVVFFALVQIEDSALGVIPKSIPGYTLARTVALSIVGVPTTSAAVRLFESVFGFPPRGGSAAEASGGAGPKASDALLVTVGAASGLDPCDLYCVLQVVSTTDRPPEGVEGTKFKTRNRNNQPWNETIELRPLVSNEAALTVTLIEHKQLGANQEIGSARVDLTDLKFDAPAEKLDLALTDANDAATSATISCEVKLVSAGA